MRLRFSHVSPGSERRQAARRSVPETADGTGQKEGPAA